MGWLEVLGMAVGLAMDAFAVSIAAGLTLERVTSRHVFRLAWHFGLFQFMMPIIGWWAGSHLSSYIAAYDHLAACGLLSVIGGKMLFEAVLDTDRQQRANPTRGWTLIGLSVATSIDALAVGLSMAFMRISIWIPCVVIGLVACAFTAIGITFANRYLRRWGRAAEVFGGCILIGIGVRVFLAHAG